MKTIIAGSRTVYDYDMVKEYIAIFVKENKITEVVSGGAKGVDTFGELWAKENNIPLEVFEANWKEYGKSAGPIRNRQMAKYADQALIICRNDSKGSINMMEQMKELKKPYMFVSLMYNDLKYIIESGLRREKV